MIAAENCTNQEVISLFLSENVDGTLECNEGLTAFDYAKENPALLGTKQYWELNDARFK